MQPDLKEVIQILLDEVPLMEHYRDFQLTIKIGLKEVTCNTPISRLKNFVK